MTSRTHPNPQLRALRRRLRQVSARQWPGLNRALAGLKPGDDEALHAFEQRLEQAAADVARRRADLPTMRYDEALPMVGQREAFLDLLRQHQVIVVAGSTGCGKSTQLPKLLLEAGFGARGLIGVTQPRRIAARSLARRVADELGEAVGERIGWQVRFAQQAGERCRVKFMTDGILLAETQGDRELRGYDAIIVDEVHERSLNIDFLLGYLRRLLPKRPDLKLVLASATLDTARYSAHFNNAPVLAVEGRGFPVEIRHRPLVSEAQGEDLDLYQGIHAAIVELNGEDPRADILVFLPGEREIRDAHRHLEGAGLRHTEIVPLYGRLSAELQDRVFKPAGGRRIVLATNVAETSLTVPRIKFVIDSGLARVMRYAPRTQVQRLQIEPISQAAAAQRAGRCGRTAPGICIRLYAEQDALRRPEFTDPELLRSSLAGVILSMLSLRLGDPDRFPFIDAPARRLLHEGWQVLFELGAVDPQRRLTEVGSAMAKLPIDVRLGRMLVAARQRDALDEGLIIAAALSIQDPRERPAERRGEADQRHAVWRDERSDFLGWINLWRDFERVAAEQTQRGLRDWCAQQLLSYPRMREWRELHRQLKLLVKQLEWTINAEPASYEALHQAILVAYLTHIGERDPKQDYRGPRQRKFRPFPSSALARSGGRWLVAASLLETRRLYALEVARIEQKWIEPLAAHLLTRQHYEPAWDADQAQAWCFEDLLLEGLPVVRRRRTRLAPLDHSQARELFLRHGLVRGEWRLRHPALSQHRQLFAEAEAKEEKLRRRGLLRDELELAAWFDQRIPGEIVDGRSLLSWLRQADQSSLQRLRLSIADLVVPEATASELELYPTSLDLGGLRLPLSYSFDPQNDADGVTASVSLADLGRIDPAMLEWLVPGLREEKVVALIKGLPKVQRRHYVPAPDFARAFLEAHPLPRGGLCESLAAFLTRVTGSPVAAADFAAVSLPDHLRLRLSVHQGDQLLSSDRDPAKLIVDLAERSR
ncbi:MAG: ATP-dependent RNA helicase HrpA, partial [Xanthomonadales bacterium]|nr:ATP-dependent RNA helicase HrpA [Xanthomonadales bacterium]